MGAGASAAGEGRVFCHRCGARTPKPVGEDVLRCGACGSTEEVEATDPRLPTTMSTAAALASAMAASESSRLSGGGGAVSSTAPAGDMWSQPSATSRVESVTVVAMPQPEDGGLLLRVMPNLVARRTPGPPARSFGDALGLGQSEDAFLQQGPGARAALAASEEDWGDMPPEPASAQLVKRLQSKPSMAESQDVVCVICADEIGEAGTSVLELSCGHAFHEQCIRRWLCRRHTCPSCRLELEVDDVRYLRSIGLQEEADALEKVEQERLARDAEKQAAARRRWVDSMHRGVPVHFGLVCSRCSATPLVGDCWRCNECDGYVLCSDCHAAHEASSASGQMASSSTAQETLAERADAGAAEMLLVDSKGNTRRESLRSGESRESEKDDHPPSHTFSPFGAIHTAGSDCSAMARANPGGLLTVLVRRPGQSAGAAAARSAAAAAPTPASSGQLAGSGAASTGGAEPMEGATSLSSGAGFASGALSMAGEGEAALAAAEVAFAAVRSLALAPLTGGSPTASSSGSARDRWPSQRASMSERRRIGAGGGGSRAA
eukprot:TRINITY_DN100863_c0_g1_i1.p1 TRINITY_DN100863_c0_g1~~TRINITY_DN100863_c0_g1_i1.p1  ORF type:complete len:549 (+),score=111.29 TRINITY_DN100863_c0_g1_i1:275-1921(+)